MYRTLGLLVILSVASGTCWHRRHWHRRHYFGYNDQFDDITNQMAEVNKILKASCSGDRTTESYELEKFVVTHRLPEYKEDYVDVVIKNGVMQTTAKKFVNDKDKFKDLRILPNSLDVGRATWNYVDGNVIVIVPFLDEKKEFCVRDDEEIRVVPRQKEKNYDLDVRFGSGKDVVS